MMVYFVCTTKFMSQMLMIFDSAYSALNMIIRSQDISEKTRLSALYAGNMLGLSFGTSSRTIANHAQYVLEQNLQGKSPTVRSNNSPLRRSQGIRSPWTSLNTFRPLRASLPSSLLLTDSLSRESSFRLMTP